MRRSTQALFLALALVWFPGTGAAVDCGDLGSQAEMNQCALAESQFADRDLDALCDQYLERLGERQKRLFTEAHKAWVRFRDLACEFESSGAEGGSAYPFVVQNCLTAMTRARIERMRSLAQCEEGDAACPARK